MYSGTSPEAESNIGPWSEKCSLRSVDWYLTIGERDSVYNIPYL
jgi:hypothetical protein